MKKKKVFVLSSLIPIVLFAIYWWYELTFNYNPQDFVPVLMVPVFSLFSAVLSGISLRKKEGLNMLALIICIITTFISLVFITGLLSIRGWS